MKISRIRAIRKHRKLWKKVAEIIDRNIKNSEVQYTMPRQYKLEALKELGWSSDNPFNTCYLCEYARNKRNKIDGRYSGENMCKYCPLVWKSYKQDRHVNIIKCDSYNGQFRAFRIAIDHKEYHVARNLALEISKLPIKWGD